MPTGTSRSVLEEPVLANLPPASLCFVGTQCQLTCPPGITLFCRYAVQDNLPPGITLFCRYAVPANLRPLVYRVGFREVGGAEEWDIMWDRYAQAPTAQEKLYILSAVSQTKDVWLIQR